MNSNTNHIQLKDDRPKRSAFNSVALAWLFAQACLNIKKTRVCVFSNEQKDWSDKKQAI